MDKSNACHVVLKVRVNSCASAAVLITKPDI